MKRILWTLSLCFSAVILVHAQAFVVPLDWHMLDYAKDSVFGISANKAYSDLLKGRKSQKVIVAVIDAGADTLQEDLKNVFWHNPREIPHNGIDDDKDGYVDDYYGWNFLGAKGNDTLNVTKDSYVVDRIYFKYKSKFGRIKDSNDVKREERPQYREWLKARSIELTKSPQSQSADSLSQILALLPRISDFKQVMLKDTFTLADVSKYDPIDYKTNAEKEIYTLLFQRVAPGTTNIQLPAALNKVVDSLKKIEVLPTTPPPPYRAEIVKDNEDDIRDMFYGNNNVAAGDVMHGTHVSGIIGAERDNGIGIDGIADNVALMEIRAVPDGDEHDKDIALGIRYAVDHGAKVINMSFGKPLSPHRQWVEDAFRYAAAHDVLLVHAAGNDGIDITNDPNYPTQFYIKEKDKSFDNMITVGASGAMKEDLIAYFSNFGAKSVDVFAPGVQINSTLPGTPVKVNGTDGKEYLTKRDENNYGQLSGTSMASPVVAGIAAVLRSYFPKLTAPQVKQLIMESVTKIDFPVNNPATGQEVPMSTLCVSGGIANLYNAVKLAEEMDRK